MIDSEQRVALDICKGEIVSTIITSATLANDFINAWQETNGDQVLSISGVCDHRDANNVEYHIRKESIDAIRILEIKV